MGFFNPADYQPVEERIRLFREKYPNGRIDNEIVFDDGERVVVRCTVYLDLNDHAPACSDYAEELKSAKGVNQTSRIENGCTSATGRALSLLGGDFSPKGKRPSREEMESVQRKTNANARQVSPVKETAPTDGRRQALLDRLNALPDSERATAKKEFLDAFGHPNDLKDSELEEAAEFVLMLETGEVKF